MTKWKPGVGKFVAVLGLATAFGCFALPRLASSEEGDMSETTYVPGEKAPRIDPEKPGLVIDGRSFPAGGHEVRSIGYEVTVPGTAAEAYRLWTTTDGVKAWLGVDCKIDLRVGGPWELYFLGPEAPQRGAEGCQVLSYVPNRMLSMSWNAPPTMPAERAQRTWIVVEFAEEGGTTTLDLKHMGFADGAGWDKVKTYFERAWPNVLAAFEKHCKAGK